MAGAIGGIMQGAASIHAANVQKNVAKKQMKQQRRVHEESSATREKASQMVQEYQGLASGILSESERARSIVYSSLGQPGTYGPGPGSTSGPLSLGVLKPTYAVGDSPLGTMTSKSGVVTGADVKLKGSPAWKGRKEWTVEGMELSAEDMAANVMGSSSYRTVSRMVAEAEQLMNRQGPLWTELNNSVVGSVYASNAAFQRDSMEQLARSLARGGSARRSGVQLAAAFQAQEQINRNRTNQLWASKLQLEEFRMANAQQTTTFAQSWVNNASGIRDSYSNALQNLTMFWSQTMAPTLAGATVGAQSATQQGILSAGQGMVDAMQTRNTAMAGIGKALGGLIESGIGAIWPDKSTPAGGGDPYSSQGGLAAGGTATL
jgi:hypothetical protein